MGSKRFTICHVPLTLCIIIELNYHFRRQLFCKPVDFSPANTNDSPKNKLAIHNLDNKEEKDIRSYQFLDLGDC